MPCNKPPNYKRKFRPLPPSPRRLRRWRRKQQNAHRRWRAIGLIVQGLMVSIKLWLGPSIHCLNRSSVDLPRLRWLPPHPDVSAWCRGKVASLLWISVARFFRSFAKITVKVDNVDSLYDVPKKVKMSAEVENGKDEEVKEQKVRKSLKKKLVEQWPAGIKVLELVGFKDF